MTAAGMSAAFSGMPPGRAPAGWWRELSRRQPQRLWFCHLLLHHVEALATVARTRRPDDFQLALLRMVSAAGNGSAGPSLNELHMDRQLLAGWLGALAADGLLG